MSRIGKRARLRELREKDEEKGIKFPHNSINTKPYKDTFFVKNAFMGAYLDRKLVDLAFLYCAYKEKSKTQFLKELVQEKANEFPTEKEMMKGICEIQLDRWIKFIEQEEFINDIHYEYKKRKIWIQYKAQLIKDLGKILPKFYLNYVIDYIQDAQF